MNIEKSESKGFIIFDCRPFVNAKVNTLKGAGVEDIKNYRNCKELIFGSIENIHNVRQSFKKALLKAYYGKEAIVKGKISFNIDKTNMKNFLSKFEETKWLEHISYILLGSITVAKYLKKGINVLVHCSDGWDRTSQICSLVQIILDPFFRTIEGFAILIEKEWISFGHQFATRNGCDFRKEKKKERSPIFIQFLHALHQIILQYPTSFEFNSNLLLFLCKEIFSNKYGTFLNNCQRDIFINKTRENTISIWSDIFLEKNKYINDNYKELNEAILIKGELQYLSIWNDYFFQYDKLGRVKEKNIIYDKEEYCISVIEEKKKSIIELLNIIKEYGLEDKVKNNKFYNLYKDELDK
jgi:phosphatidylinositol-3-phosphatase